MSVVNDDVSKWNILARWPIFHKLTSYSWGLLSVQLWRGLWCTS